MATNVELIRLEPDTITFDMSEKEPTVTLRVHNTSEKVVAFKVKTTHPKRYLVRPNHVIPVGGTSTVKISLHIKDAKQLRQERISGTSNLGKDCKENKFLVQCVVVKESMLAEVEELHASGASKELGNLLKKMWTETTRDEFVNKKLTCFFEYPEDVGVLIKVNQIENAEVPFPLELGADSHKGSAMPEGSGADDIVELRKKYNELINFTVQLTAERDRFKANLKDATKELQLLKKGQQAKVSSVRSMDESASAGGTLVNDSVAGAFSLWQIMLVAVIAFIMGRLLM